MREEEFIFTVLGHKFTVLLNGALAAIKEKEQCAREYLDSGMLESAQERLMEMRVETARFDAIAECRETVRGSL